MPWRKCQIASLLLAVSLLGAPGCAHPGSSLQTFPSAADLTKEPKPVPPADIVTSEAAADAYDVSLETWGDRGWQAVGRVCLWAKASGFKDAPC